VDFDGHPVVGLSDVELSRLRGRRIGFVFQAFHLVSGLSVMENVEMPLLYQRVRRAERHRRAQEILTRVQLSHRTRHRPNELSGGECQRAAIARALVTDPDVILADEPTGNLDSKTGREILDIFAQLHQQGKTLVVITHDPTVAASIPRIVRIVDGVLQPEGSR
jgi:putative ABC transport system ATP-binding protein